MITKEGLACARPPKEGRGGSSGLSFSLRLSSRGGITKKGLAGLLREVGQLLSFLYKKNIYIFFI